MSSGGVGWRSLCSGPRMSGLASHGAFCTFCHGKKSRYRLVEDAALGRNQAARFFVRMETEGGRPIVIVVQSPVFPSEKLAKELAGRS